MKGEVLGFSDQDGGAISGEDGARYRFARSDWRGAGAPAAGDRVDFDVAQGRAIDIYPLAAPSPAPASIPPPAAAVPANPSPSFFRTPLFAVALTVAILFYLLVMPPTVLHPRSGVFKPLLLIGLSVAAIIWRGKRSFDRTNEYGVQSYKGFGHVLGSGAVDLVVALGAIAGLFVGGAGLIF